MNVGNYIVVPKSVCWYAFWVLVGTVLIRLVIGTVRIIQNLGFPAKRFFRSLCDDLRDGGYLVPLLVGTIELAVYPFWMSLGSWQAIAAWVGIKTAASWRWQENKDRRAYTNFLFGNALVIFAAFLLTNCVYVWARS